MRARIEKIGNINYLIVKAGFTSETSDLSDEMINDMIHSGVDMSEHISWDDLWINPNNIVAFNRSSRGLTTLRLSGESWLIYMTVEEFIEWLNLSSLQN